jgi:hypothetical protein
MSARPLPRRCCIALLAASLGLGASADADAPLVYATIEPAKIAMGETAQLTITNFGAADQPLSLPKVSGLEFDVMSHHRQMEFINGSIVTANAIVVRVTPEIPGIFTIPAVTAQSQPLILEVMAPPAPKNAPRPPPAVPPAAPPPTVVPRGGAALLPLGSDELGGIQFTPDGSAFARLRIPKKTVYVGESVPVDIELGLRGGFVTSLNGLPTLTGGDFTLTNLSRQPERQERLIEGSPFILLTWHSVIAAIKPGDFSLAVQTPLTVKVSTESKRDSQLDNMLGDPFLHRFFGVTIPKDITVSSPPFEFTVMALPTEGRPKDFSGAVGTFKLESDVSATNVSVGDPLTLRMRVIGAGNFDRVDSSMLDHLDRWKTYPPKSSFKPGDAIGHRGEKVFEQPLIALQPGTQVLPPLSFSYFDTATNRYETIRSAPIGVTIASAQGDADLANTPSNPLLRGLRPDHVAGAADARWLTPLYLRPQFLGLSSVLAVTLAGAWLGLMGREWRARRRHGPGRVAAATAAGLLNEMRDAARVNDAHRFFAAALSVVQQDLAARWGIAPVDVTSAALARLGTEGDALRRLFARADEAKYSGHQPTAEDFAAWFQVVRTHLREPAS